MFEQLGLNVARQPDNGANPRPDNRSGWLEGETPDVLESHLAGEGAREDEDEGTLSVRLWDPSTQLRFQARRAVPPRPDGAANKHPEPNGRSQSSEGSQPNGHPQPDGHSLPESDAAPRLAATGAGRDAGG